jgi:hypothetical protein
MNIGIFLKIEDCEGGGGEVVIFYSSKCGIFWYFHMNLLKLDM